MYRITARIGQTSIVLHDIARMADSASISWGKLKQGINKIDTLSFRLLPNNPGYDIITPFLTHIECTHIESGRLVFSGRALAVTAHMGSDGKLYQEAICESYLGYLKDSIQPYKPMATYSVAEYFALLIENHNATIEEEKRFKVGRVTVDELQIARMLTYKDTWMTMVESLIPLGGELKLRRESDGLYIDFLKEASVTRLTAIEAGKNMQAIDREDDPTQLITRLWPLGRENRESGEFITIEAVNDGKAYIDSSLIEEFGIINGTVRFDGVVNPSTLLSNANSWLARNNKAIRSYKISALDLSTIGLDFDSFALGDTYPIRNKLLGITESLRVIGISTNIIEPWKSELVFGDRLVLASELTAEAARRAAEAAEIAGEIGERVLSEMESQLANESSIIYSIIEERATAIRRDTEQLIFEAISNYVRTGDYESFQQTVMSQLQVMADGIQMNFTQVIQQITEVNGAVETQLQEYAQYIRFENGSIVLGEMGNPMQCVIDNESISFVANGFPVAYFANDRLYVANTTVLQEMLLGNWSISANNPTGRLVFDWIGPDIA